MAENLGSANIEIQIELQKLKEGLQNAVNVIARTIEETKGKLNINPNVETSKAVSGLKELGTASGEVSEKLKIVGDSAAKSMEAFSKMELAKEAMNGLKESINAAIDYAMKFVNEFIEADVASQKLQMGLTRLGDGDYFGKLKAQADELHKTTPFDDDDITNMQAMLTTFGMTGPEIEKVTPRMLDLAVAFSQGSETGMDLVQTATLIGKATGADMVGAMQRVGVIMSDTQKKEFEMSSGMDRINILSKILTQNTNITAEAYGKTLAGQMKIASNQIKDVKEEIGTKLAPAMMEILGIVKDVISGFSALPAPLQMVIVAFGGLAVVIPPLIPMLMALQAATGGWIGPLLTLAGMLVGGGVIAGGLALLGNSAETSAKGIDDIKVKSDEAKTSLQNLQTLAQGYDADVQSNAASNSSYAAALASVKEQYPGISAGIDDVTGKEKIHKDMVDDLIASKKEEIRIKEEAIQIEQNEAWAKNLEEFTTAQENYNKKLEEEKSLREELNNEEARKPSSDAGTSEKAYNIGVLTKHLEEAQKWLAKNTDGTEKFKQGIQQMLVSAMKIGNVETQFNKIQASVKGNESAVNVLKGVMMGFTNPAIASLMGLDLKLKSSTSLFKAFSDAMNKIKSGDFLGGMMAFQGVMKLAEDVKVTEPKAPKSGTGTSKSGEKKDPKEEEKKALQDINSEIEAEIQRKEKKVALGDIEKKVLDEYINSQKEKLQNDLLSVKYKENENIIGDEILNLREKEKQTLDEIIKQQRENNKLIDDVDTFIQKRHTKLQAGYKKELSETESAYKQQEEKIMNSKLSYLQKEEEMNKLRNEKMQEMDISEKSNKSDAEDELHRMIVQNSQNEYEIELENINEKYSKEREDIDNKYSDETVKSKIFQQLDIKRENDLSNLRVKHLGGLNDAFQAVGQAAQSKFSEVWNSIFGEANSLFEIFIQNIMQQLTGKLFQKGIKALLEQLGGPIGGFLGSLFDTGGYTGGGDEKEIAGFVHKKEYVIRADALKQPGNMAIAALMNAGTSIQGMIHDALTAGQNIVPRIDMSVPVINVQQSQRANSGTGTNVKIDMHGDLTELFAVKVMDKGTPTRERRNNNINVKTS